MIGHCGRGGLPAALGLGLRQLDDRAPPDVDVERAVHDEDAAPDDLARPADALDRAAAEPEVHRRLALADGARVAADEVRRRDRAGDLEDPHVVVAVRRAPAHVVEGGRRVEAERGPDAVGDERVDRRALVDLVEVRDRPALVQDRGRRRRADRRAVGVVEQALGQVGGRAPCP